MRWLRARRPAKTRIEQKAPSTVGGAKLWHRISLGGTFCVGILILLQWSFDSCTTLSIAALTQKLAFSAPKGILHRQLNLSSFSSHSISNHNCLAIDFEPGSFCSDQTTANLNSFVQKRQISSEGTPCAFGRGQCIASVNHRYLTVLTVHPRASWGFVGDLNLWDPPVPRPPGGDRGICSLSPRVFAKSVIIPLLTPMHSFQDTFAASLGARVTSSDGSTRACTF